jgi:hypothetical protein
MATPLNGRRALLLALGSFCLSTAVVGAFAAVDLLGELVELPHLAVGLVAVAAILAARSGELPCAWLVAFGLSAGFGVHLGGIGITGETPGIPFRLTWAVVVGIVGATALGLPGGAIGLGLRRAARRRTSGASE